MSISSILLLSALSASALATEPYLDQLLRESREARLSESRQWLNLVHYRKGWFGGHASQADGQAFFLAQENLAGQDGKTSPQAELEATIRGFFAEGPGDSLTDKSQQHPQCRFPARYLWLKEQLRFDPSRLPEKTCPRFESFKAATSARSASVVFSSYYLNNPSSAFGHSFIRLNKSERSSSSPQDDAPGGGERLELLDYGINYAAVMDTGNPVLYAFKGMTGMFPGTFTSIPYYYKVREYNDSEARDLWEYDLNLTPRQIEMLTAHLWELGSTYFDYYYLTENCSYHVLTALEAANPDLTLTERQSKVVIPVDTIKVLTSEPGLVRAVHYRPSVRAVFEKRLERVPPGRLTDLKRLTETRAPERLPSDLGNQEKVALLDAALDYLDLRYYREMVDRGSEAARWKQKFLVARAGIPVPSEEIRITPAPADMPHVGHGSRRLGLEGGYSADLGAYEKLSYRFALHDLLDPRAGYPEYAQLEMFGAEARHNARSNQLWLDELNLFSIVSLTPLDRFKNNISWRVSLGGKRFYDQTCDFCFGAAFEVGGGFAVRPFNRLPLTTYLLSEFEAAASPGFFGSHLRPGAGPGGGIRLHLSDSLIAHVHGAYHYQLFVDHPHAYAADFGLRWGFSPSFALSASAAAYPRSKETSLGLMLYH